ncbi:MAG: hypothetical protein J7K68_05145 [Candidatus Diapherotrites archaeon]|nr:hypothetical protein [Candidatus Diapherotrites archaeon]
MPKELLNAQECVLCKVKKAGELMRGVGPERRIGNRPELIEIARKIENNPLWSKTLLDRHRMIVHEGKLHTRDFIELVRKKIDKKGRTTKM